MDDRKDFKIQLWDGWFIRNRFNITEIWHGEKLYGWYNSTKWYNFTKFTEFVFMEETETIPKKILTTFKLYALREHLTL